LKESEEGNFYICFKNRLFKKIATIFSDTKGRTLITIKHKLFLEKWLKPEGIA